MKALHRITRILITVLVLASCTTPTDHSSYDRQIAKATGSLSLIFQTPLDPKWFETKEIDSFLLIRVDTFATHYPYPNSYWHGLFDLTNDDFNYTNPISLKTSDIQLISPVIRKLRHNGLHVQMIKNLNNSKYTFEFSKISSDSRGVQQRYILKDGKWEWLENNKVFDQELENVRISDYLN